MKDLLEILLIWGSVLLFILIVKIVPIAAVLLLVFYLIKLTGLI